jgi:choline dehydrogenase-like flavoprotein
LICETPRAVHQPYLTAKGLPTSEFSIEPTGVFNTAELLINQVGLTPGSKHGDGPGLHLLLNSFVEDVRRRGEGYELVCRNTVTSAARVFVAPTVVLAGGSIETPKLMSRSSMFEQLPMNVRELVGRGMTDHPTTDEMATFVTGIGDVPVPKTTHAKIVFYSRGLRDGQRIRFPFNVEMNINHEYWHLRDNDPNDPNQNKPGAFSTSDPRGPSRVDLKFSFGNCLDDDNGIQPAAPFEYVPEIRFGNLSHVDRLKDSRFPALAGWHMGSANDIFDVLNDLTDQIFSQFQIEGVGARPDDGAEYGKKGKGFGWGTVHHATGTMRMPYRAAHDRPFASSSVVDDDLQIVGADRLHVCDMSVMPFSSAANPVRTLVALALRLSKKLADPTG